MKKSFIIILSALFLFACESDLQVYTDDFTVTPVVYCLINPVDSVHTIRLSKSIDAKVSPFLRKDDPDQLVFDEAYMEVRLITNTGDTITKYPQKVDGSVKAPGLFGDNTHGLYSFKQVMDRKGISLVKGIELEIEIPGLPTVRGSSDILVKPRIRFPHVNAQYVFVDPTRPILVQWYASAWNEVDIQFDVLEQYSDSTVTQSFIFEEKANILLKDDICEIRFPYELIIQNVARTLDWRKNVIRRYFGPILIKVHSGNEEFAYYMETKDGINDFSEQTISNLENAIGVLGCKLSFKFDSLYFDQFTRFRLADEPDLAPFKFREF